MNANKRRLLIIEDNELDSSQIAKILDNGDLIDIEIVNTGVKALELIKENDYDCIIVDYMLPDIGGLELVTEISNIKKITDDTGTDLFSQGFFSKRKNTAETICQQDLIERCNFT